MPKLELIKTHEVFHAECGTTHNAQRLAELARSSRLVRHVHHANGWTSFNVEVPAWNVDQFHAWFNENAKSSRIVK